MPQPTDERRSTLKALEQALNSCRDRKERIALLLRELEEVSALESLDHLVPFSSDKFDNADPIVRLLIAEGEPVVKPLIECLAGDPRLTRSFGLGRYGQDTTQHRPRGVGEAAFVALNAILQESFFRRGEDVCLSAIPNHRREALAQRIQRFYEQHYRLSRYERCYRILMDDRAPSILGARPQIPSARPETRTPFKIPATSGGRRAGWRRVAYAGRAAPGQEKSVTYRASGTASARSPVHVDTPDARCSYRLGPQCGLEAASRDGERYRCGKGPSCRAADSPWTAKGDAEDRPDLEACRVGRSHGNPGICDLGQRTRGRQRGLLRNPVQFRDDPRIQALAQWLFNDPASPLKTLSMGAGMESDHSGDGSLVVRLLVFPAYREQVVRLLGDRSRAGPCRVCDRIAHNLSDVRGLPRCELGTPEADRNRATAVCRRIVQQYGRYFAKFSGGFHRDGSIEVISLPRLKRPATPEDVQAGPWAIFSLAGLGPARVVSLGKAFDVAKWTTLKDAPALSADGNQASIRGRPSTTRMASFVRPKKCRSEENGNATTDSSDVIQSPRCLPRKSTLIVVPGGGRTLTDLDYSLIAPTSGTVKVI